MISRVNIVHIARRAIFNRHDGGDGVRRLRGRLQSRHSACGTGWERRLFLLSAQLKCMAHSGIAPQEIRRLSQLHEGNAH